MAGKGPHERQRVDYARRRRNHGNIIWKKKDNIRRSGADLVSTDCLKSHPHAEDDRRPR